MELSDNSRQRHEKRLRKIKAVIIIKPNKMERKAEDDYQRHQENPRPSKESIEEPNDDKAGRNIPWTVVIAIVIMLIAFFFIFGKYM